jgi:hypothetical protein
MNLPIFEIYKEKVQGAWDTEDLRLYVIQFVTDFRQVGGFLRVLQFPPPIQNDRHEITDLLLKVVLNTITLTLPIFEIYKEKVQGAWDTEDLRLLIYEICDPLFNITFCTRTWVLIQVRGRMDDELNCS